MKIIIGLFLCTLSLSVVAAFPVVPMAPDQQSALVDSGPPELAANKRLVYDLYRMVMAGQLDKLDTVASRENWVNHNPNEASGYDGMIEYLRNAFGDAAGPLPDTLPGLVTIVAENDTVVLAFARTFDHPEKPGETYSSTWFDMFRIEDGKVVEHWDPATLHPE
ncbi:nuclear transport factor 2 family protein [Elongatibacter sediminis]|uniref:Nuclear transport factor 2 family protein n=1 Tax=Elongatibacter sediminis TaxID=3119006 RepID=A0AAW9R9D2_9GAMM